MYNIYIQIDACSHQLNFSLWKKQHYGTNYSTQSLSCCVVLFVCSKKSFIIFRSSLQHSLIRVTHMLLHLHISYEADKKASL